MLSFVVVPLETIVADMIGLSITFETATRMVMVIHVDDDNRFLVFVVGGEGDGFVSSSCVNTNQAVLWQSGLELF